MIKVPFCYKVWGLSVDNEGNEDYGYIKLTMDIKEMLTQEEYDKLHLKMYKLVPTISDAEVKLVLPDEYMLETDCDDEELEILMGDFISD